jgi:hypothetical protein
MSHAMHESFVHVKVLRFVLVLGIVHVKAVYFVFLVQIMVLHDQIENPYI